MSEIRQQTTESYEQRVFEISRRAGHMIRAHAGELANTRSQQKNIQRIFQFMNRFLPEGASDIEDSFVVLKDSIFSDRDKFLEKAAEIMIALCAQNFSLQELEDRLKNIHAEDYGYQELSRGLTYDIEQSKVHLHIPVTFFASSKEALKSFVEGLKILAEKIKHDPEFIEITEIIGHSSFVQDKAKIVNKMLGFTITPQADGSPSDEAIMSKDELLSKYGN